MACMAKATILLLLAALICNVHPEIVSYSYELDTQVKKKGEGTCKSLTSKCTTTCDRRDIQVRQALTGKFVEGKLQFRVSISTQCPCPQAEVVVRCFGLSSALTVDKTKIQILSGDLCSVANGEPIARGSPIVFTYAYSPKNPLYFPAVSAKTQC